MRVRSPNTIESAFDHDDITKRLAEIKDPAYLYQRRMMYQKKKYDDLLQKISFLDLHLKQEERRYDYPDDLFRPFIFFFKFLAKRPDVETNPLNRLKLWFPDTIIVEGDAPPMWLYSSPEGQVHRTDSFTAKNIINKMGSFASPDELVAVLKKPQAKEFSYVGNDIRLLTLRDLSLVAQSIVSSRGDILCVQKFVKSMGPKAFVCRTCWRRDRNPYVWVITNTKDFFSEDENLPEHQQYITNASVMNSCTIVNSIRGRYVEETAPYVANIVRYIEHNIPGAKFEEFIADFIKDESGTWWMVNVRGFVLVDKMNIAPRSFLAGPEDIDYMPVQVKKKKPEDYQKVALCKYCEIMYPVEELLHKMTLKSIIQTDKHLMHRGKTFKWLERSEIKQIDTVALYQEHKVCNSCYKLHEETEKLRQIEFEFAKALGIPVNPEKKIDLVSATTFGDQDMKNYMLDPGLHNQVAQNRSKVDIADTSDLPPLKSNQSAIFSDTVGSPKSKKNQYVKRYKMMLYLHMLYDVPKDIDANKNYYIEYTILGQKQRYKVDLASAFSINGDILIPLNKLRMFFFFGQDRKCVNDFINEQKAITLYLYCESDKIGTVSFELNDFLSDNVIKREMFKVFSGKKLPILSWGLKASVGLVDGGREDISRVRLTEHKNVYITTPDYYTCDALPEEWIQSFEETSHNITQLLNKSEMRSSRYSPGSMPRNNSARKLGVKTNLKHLNVSKLNNSKEMKVKYDIPEMGSEMRMSSPSRSLFQDEKSISHVPIEKEAVDESMEVVRKILVESIQDYEKGAIKPKKKVSSAKTQQTQKIEKSPKVTLRSWSSGIGLNPINE